MLKQSGCAIILALLGILILLMLIGAHQYYERQTCFDRNTRGRGNAPDSVLKEIAEQCTRNPDLNKPQSN
jgi:hypothetical protein